MGGCAGIQVQTERLRKGGGGRDLLAQFVTFPASFPINRMSAGKVTNQSHNA